MPETTMRLTNTLRLMLLTSLASTALIGQALALDAQAFVDRVAKVYEKAGYELSFGPARMEGDSIVVDGVTVAIAGVEEEPVKFDTEITFSGVSEAADGSYRAASVTIPDIDTTIEDEEEGATIGVTVSDIRADGLYLPAPEALTPVAMMQTAAAMSSGPVSITRDGVEIFSIESTRFAAEFAPDQTSAVLESVDTVFAMNGISVDLTTMSEEDPDTAAVIEQLGLLTVNGAITQKASWTLSDGRVVVDEFLFDFDQVGALNFTSEFTGFTPALLEQLEALQQQAMAAGEMSDEQQQALMMSSMAAMQGVNIVKASVRYDDASLASNLLDFFASESGASRADFAAGIKAMLPSILAETGVPALADLAVPALSAFLDDPRSIELKVAPPSPVSLLVMMAAAANPAGLITALGLSLEANSPAQ
ncbi:MAG: hypothetical protein ABS76_00285 [Pelagibacterium sp. SCN 64-44]|nr:MAG: hypothetical protein ABS76_00285 [Pelagibacterium sp. SCN 64-44]